MAMVRVTNSSKQLLVVEGVSLFPGDVQEMEMGMTLQVLSTRNMLRLDPVEGESSKTPSDMTSEPSLPAVPSPTPVTDPAVTPASVYPPGVRTVAAPAAPIDQNKPAAKPVAAKDSAPVDSLSKPSENGVDSK